ncbi:TPA: magnesium transporter [Candidatus Dependentiae bacterium]|nr:MAG: Magnesium transporter [candidate division TM6 bacterium GW2011_GWF2_43_87]HBL98276.1 magnesium transporter [Candidatus Dependentiae bacterium]
MEREELFAAMVDHLDEVVAGSSDIGKLLHSKLEALHPADAAAFLGSLKDEDEHRLFLSFSRGRQLEVFKELSNPSKAHIVALLDDNQRRAIFTHLSVDELTDFLEEISDQALEHYLRLLQKKDRDQVVSVLQFEAETAGRHMDVSVLSLINDFTVEKSIQLIRRLQPDRELHRSIFVTDRDGLLRGYILLEDLVLKNADVRLSSFLRKNEIVVESHEDREEVAYKMMHYNVMTVPVVDKKGVFLGVIPGDELVDIIEEESSEDIYRMATMSPIKDSYLETSFWKLLGQRSSILIVLLFVQSLSTSLIAHYQAVLASLLILFIPMLTSAGGNVSSQTSAFAIKGLATGEIDDQNFKRFIRREFFMALMIGAILGAFAFVRVFLWHADLWSAVAVSCSLTAIVVVSVMLGSAIPLVLKKFNFDPAHSAGPLLATLMDIIGLSIFCVISSFILS